VRYPSKALNPEPRKLRRRAVPYPETTLKYLQNRSTCPNFLRPPTHRVSLVQPRKFPKLGGIASPIITAKFQSVRTHPSTHTPAWCPLIYSRVTCHYPCIRSACVRTRISALRRLNTRSVPVIRRGAIDRYKPKSENANKQPTQTENPLKTLIIGYLCVETTATPLLLLLLLSLIKHSIVKNKIISLFWNCFNFYIKLFREVLKTI